MRKALKITAAFMLIVTFLTVLSSSVYANSPIHEAVSDVMRYTGDLKFNVSDHNPTIIWREGLKDSINFKWNVSKWPDIFFQNKTGAPANEKTWGVLYFNFTPTESMNITGVLLSFSATVGDLNEINVTLYDANGVKVKSVSIVDPSVPTEDEVFPLLSVLTANARYELAINVTGTTNANGELEIKLWNICIYFRKSGTATSHVVEFDLDNYVISHTVVYVAPDLSYYDSNDVLNTEKLLFTEIGDTFYVYLPLSDGVGFPIYVDTSPYDSVDTTITTIDTYDYYRIDHILSEDTFAVVVNFNSTVKSAVNGLTPVSIMHNNFTLAEEAVIQDEQKLTITVEQVTPAAWDVLMIGGYPKPETLKIGALTLTENDTIDDMMASTYGFYYDEDTRNLLIKFPLSTVTITASFASGFETTWYLRFVDQAGDPLKDAYVEVWNETANELLFTGRTNSEGWLNATILAPHFDTKYNMTVKWDPDGTDSFKVFEDGLISGLELATVYNCTGPTVAIATKVAAVEFTALDDHGNLLDYYTTTFEYNYTGKKYSVSGMPADAILGKIPYDLSWGSTQDWTVRIYWDQEYLRMTFGIQDDTVVVNSYPFADITYANFTLADPATYGPYGPVSTLPDNVGYLILWTDVHRLYIQLKDWYGDDLETAATGYGIVKVSIHDANNPSKLLATATADPYGRIMIEQFPNVTATLTVYWLSHEIVVNTTTIIDPTDYEFSPLNVYCQLVPAKLTLWDKRPSPGVLQGAKITVTWPNLLEHETVSSTEAWYWGWAPGVIQLPPYWDDRMRWSILWDLHGYSGYLPFGDTKFEVYWSITPEDPASWVLVRTLTVTVESNGTTGYVNVYVDGEIAETPGGAAMENWDDVVEYDVICDVFDAHIVLVDINGNPLISPTVVLEHPTGAVSIMPASPTGALTLVQVPGGEWHITAVYKNLWVKPYGNDLLNVTDNIYTAVEFTFAFVDANLRMTKWGSETEGIAGINVTLSWEGNATITGDTGTWEEGWVTSDGGGWANFAQIPAGTLIDVEAYTIHDTTDYPHFAGKGNVFVGPYEDELILAPTNYEGVHHVYIYDFAIKLRDATGSLMPSTLPYTNASIAMVTFEYGNVTHTNELVYYSLNGSHVFIGGEDYELEVYWAGVRVFNGTITVPSTTDPEVFTPETSIELRVYPVTFTLYDWKHEDEITDIELTLSWLGMNMTTMGDIYEKIVNATDIYGVIFDGLGYDPTIAYVYNVTVIVPGELPIYIPVWMIEDVWRGTPITVAMKVIPGVTVDVPEDADSFVVGCITTTGAKVNVSSAFETVPAVTGLPNAGYGVLNFTGLNSTHWLDIWSYDSNTRAFDWKVTAYDMAAIVEVAPGVSAEGFTVDVYWKDLDEFLGSSMTDENGVATFTIVFWGNDTLYTFKAYKEPEKVIPGFKFASDNVDEVSVKAEEDDMKAELDFTLYIGLQALSATGKPLPNAFVYAVRYTSVDEAEGGTIAAFGYTDEDGYVYLPFTPSASDYTVRIVWFGVNVYDSYEKEVDPDVKILSPTIFYTAVADVFDVTVKLIDDIGRRLPEMKYEFVGSAPIEYSEIGLTGTDGTFTATLVPKGDYKLTAWWRDTNIKILEVDLTIDRNWAELPIKCKVYDAIFTFKTVRGTPLANAYVKVKYPDGRTVESITDDEGKTSVTQIPIGDVEVVEIRWLDTPIELEVPKATVDKTGEYAFKAVNVYILTVKVMGTRGQGLGPSTVIVYLGEREVATIETDSSGVGEIELPAASYTVKANFKGRTAEGTISLTKDDTLTVTIDVFATILGRPFSTAEFFGELVLLPVVIAIIVYLVAYEYYAWRRRRLAVVPPTPT